MTGIIGKETKAKIAVLYIVTGEYIVFWKAFYLNFKKHFLNNSDVHFLVFTDADDFIYMNNDDVHVHKVPKLEWPFPTLMRFHMFLDAEQELTKYDYCFFMNANMLCVEDITEEEFLPCDDRIVVVEHPGFFKNKLFGGTEYAINVMKPERRKESTAYIEPGSEQVYICGGVNGGSTGAYIKMMRELRDNINKDLLNGVIAIYHDESHINSYIVRHNDVIIRGAEYCHPDGWALPVAQKIMVMYKGNVIEADHIKGTSTKENEATKKSLFRMNQRIEVMKKISIAYERGVSIRGYFEKHRYNNIAIFGYRDFGVYLCDILKGSNINVKYIIDNKLDEIDRDIELIKGDAVGEISGVDCIIISAMAAFYMLYASIIDQVSVPVISFEKVAHDIYIESL